jgi:1,4-dihydroxy-2-naphthoate octaprenyltransferase
LRISPRSALGEMVLLPSLPICFWVYLGLLIRLEVMPVVREDLVQTANNKESRTILEIWWLAARPKTLPAAAAPVIVGTAVALFEREMRLFPALAALLAALLLQIGANFANDVFDFHKGADTRERLGPMRVTQAGLLTPRQVTIGMWIVFALAAILGIYMTFVSGWPVIAIGLASILAAIAYTWGPLPFGYHGLGELFVFLFFGLAAVAGTFYVQAVRVSPLAWWSALPMGFLSSAILVVNNLRDIDTDRAAGKKTLAVLLGPDNTRVEYTLLLIAAYATPLAIWLLGLAPAWVLLSWLSLPLAFNLVGVIYREKGRPLNRALAGTGRLELLFGILLSLGLLITRL